MIVAPADRSKITDAYIHVVSACNELKQITFSLDQVNSNTSNKLAESLAQLSILQGTLRYVMTMEGITTPTVSKE